MSGVIKDAERFKSLFELFKETRNQLSDMNSAYESELPGAVMSGTIERERKEQRREVLKRIGWVIVLITGWLILTGLAWLYNLSLIPFAFGLDAMVIMFSYACLG